MKRKQGAKKKKSTLDPAELTSPVWVFFRMAREGEDQGYVYCIANDYKQQSCNNGKVKISKKGEDRCLRVENAKSHVQRCHSSWWSSIQKASAAGEDVRAKFEALCEVAGKRETKRQTTVGAAVTVRKPGRLQKELAFLIFLVRNKIAFHALTDEVSIAPMYESFNIQLRGAESIKKLTFALHEVALREAASAIREAGAYNITMDYWTASNGKKFLAITYHWTDKDWKVRAQTLHLAPVQAAHTADLTNVVVDTRTNNLFSPLQQYDLAVEPQEPPK